MTPDQATKLLNLPADSTQEDREARFLQLRSQLEERIAKAPTPGLKEKYRASLTEITLAFETLTLASDSSNLPVLRRVEEPAVETKPPASAAGSPPTVGSAASAPRGNREFYFVVAIAIAVFGAGGWWLVQTRKEAAERTRLEQIARTEAEQKAAAARARAEQEKARQDELHASLRAIQAELKVRWDQVEREVAAADRKLSELKADLRASDKLPPAEKAELQFRTAAQQELTEWFSSRVGGHRLKASLAKLDALLSARSLVEAGRIAKDAADDFATLETDVAEQKKQALQISGSLRMASSPSGLAVDIVDAFGRKQTGTTPLELGNLLPGEVHVTAFRPGFPAKSKTLAIKRSALATVDFSFTPAVIAFEPASPELRLSLRWEPANGATRINVPVLEVNPASSQFSPGSAFRGKTEISVLPGLWQLNVTGGDFEEQNLKEDLAEGKRLVVKSQPRKLAVVKFNRVTPDTELTLNGQKLGASSLRFADGSVVPAGATVKVNDEPTSLEALTIKEGLRLPAGPVIFGLSRTGYLPEEVRLTLDWGQEVSVNPQYAASGKYASRLGLEWGLYLNPEELELTRLDPTGREPRTQALWKAMGARIEKKEGPFWIYKVEEKVAAETGLKPGDQAQSISLPVPNTTKMQPPIPVAGKTPEELSKLLTGPLGRPVELTIVSAGQSARKITVMHRPALIPNPQPGQRWSFDLGYWLVPIAAGEFLMGGPWGSEPTDALPLTKVKLTEGFWISESEVTQALWEKITNSNPSKTKGSNLPVTNITFNEAKNFCRLLTERERNEGRLSEEYFFALPTEAQWEYAARAGTNINPTRAPDKKNGAEKNPALFQPMGWFYSNAPGVNIVQPVRTRQPNAWGVYDMLGNAWEWVDAEFKPYPGGEVTDYHEPARLNPVRRGGSVNNPPYYYYHWRVRDTMTGSGNTGLRIVLKKIARPASSGTR